MPIRICYSFGQLFLSFYKMDSQRGETVERSKETIKNGKKKLTDDEVQDLTELLELHKKGGERKGLCIIDGTF